MPGRQRICPAGEVFLVLNRAVGRLTIFEKSADYDAFKSFPIQDDEQLLIAIRYVERNPVRASFEELADALLPL